MQALERLDFNDFWITIIMVCLLIAIFFLKILDAKKLIGYTFSMFSNHFIEEEITENTSFLSPFQNIIFLFSMTVLSLFLYHLIIAYGADTSKGFYTFFITFLGVFGYFILKWLLEYLFSVLFLIKKPIRFFLVSKSSYLYSVSFYLFVALILVEYSQLTLIFLVYFSFSLFLIRFILHFAKNKNLIFSKLFYFILYLCTFEIAPLLILFKLMF